LETKAFAELGLSPKVLAAVEAAGYTTATPIQSAGIPVALTGRDVLGIAQTGTGKTAAFTLPMICRLETGRARARMPRSLILAPTRELAAQVAQAFEKYGVNHKLDVALLIGGVSMDDQVKKLDRGVDVLIATPGRLLDHFGRGRIMLMGVEILVIDEADRMLDMGFIPDIEKICKLLPPRRQTLFFSATMPPEITRLVDQFLKEPVRVEVAKPATTAKTITQRFRLCRDGEDWAKREALRELMRVEDVRNAIIFCNRKRDVAILLKSLLKHGFNAGALHGDMEQSARTATLDKFRAGEIMFLAASDVAARGLDIPDVSHVFNYDLPWQGDDYVHRIGRTGRAGKSGYAASLVTLDDLKLLKDIEKITGETPVWLGDEPTEEDVASSGKRRRGRGRVGDARGRSVGDARGRSGGDARGRSGGDAQGRSVGDARRRSGGDARRRSGGDARGRSGEQARGRGREDVHSGSGGSVGGGEARAEGGRDRGRSERQRRPERGEGLRHFDPTDTGVAFDRAPESGEPRPQHHTDDRRPPRDRDRDRQPRQDRPQRADHDRPARPQHAERPQREAREPQQPREPRPPRQQGEQPQRSGGQRHGGGDAQPERQGRTKPAGSAPGGLGGFADNVPAFLRKPTRPVKVASE
jgi:superfamily II DNA/RNA helicase